MSTFLWPSDDGWPYPDGDGDVIDITTATDDDLLAVLSDVHLLDSLDQIERAVIVGRFGLDGHVERSVKQLRHELGLSREDVRLALGSGLAKLRAHLA